MRIVTRGKPSQMVRRGSENNRRRTTENSLCKKKDFEAFDSLGLETALHQVLCHVPFYVPVLGESMGRSRYPLIHVVISDIHGCQFRSIKLLLEETSSYKAQFP